MSKTIKKDQVIDSILSYIIQNNLKAGDKLPAEEELAKTLGVSRVSIREGLQGLKFLGLLKSYPRRGTILQELDFAVLSRFLSFQLAFSKFSFEQLIEARCALELGALEAICGKLSEEQLNELEQLALDSRHENNDDICDADKEFHSALLKMSGNVILFACSRILTTFFKEYQHADPQTNRAAVVKAHLMLVKALRYGNLDFARGVLKQHVMLWKEEK